ncbi:hypothetical protein [Citrobacter freundii]|uniref:Uncharacterized protein n=1 Tax=Citrobacter freundii TaxID=546 RepID=A0A7G2IIR8_CITFR|nr:hypothetical protein [Citrobacter freundii]
MTGYHRNSLNFLISLQRICIINQRLYIVYVRLATNLLQITEFTIKRPGKKQVYSGRTCPGIGTRYVSSHYVRPTVQFKSRLADAACPMSGARPPRSPGTAGDRRDFTSALRVYSRRPACVHLLHAKRRVHQAVP